MTTGAIPFYVSLAEAAFCCDCECVSSREKTGQCAVCGSNATIDLNKILNRKEPVILPEFPDRDGEYNVKLEDGTERRGWWTGRKQTWFELDGSKGILGVVSWSGDKGNSPFREPYYLEAERN